ncbi:MAG: hypothetical protein GF383_05330 [Candidatus Lokiarchaeota archaeon]|nr:hypothetical protein [Candidatus Lokiarchaeota archaeon]MBD3339315.1 hypothetical protein [Candidatus Lokiarchaeota archaeon]
MEIEYPPEKQMHTCLECGGIIKLIQEKGKVVCQECGLIITEDNYNTSISDKRYFNARDIQNKIRNGPPQTPLTDIRHSTRLKIGNIKNPDLKRAAKQNNYLEWSEKNLLTAANEIKRICSSLKLPDYVKSMAISLYRKYIKNNVLSGRSISGMVAACVYFVCRKNKISRTIQDISNLILQKNENKREVYNCYKELVKKFNLKTPPPDPSSYVPRLISELGLNQKVEAPTIRIIKAFTSRTRSTGKDPRGIAAGALYLICKMIDERISQKEIAKICKITNVTLCKRYNEILDNLFQIDKK